MCIHVCPVAACIVVPCSVRALYDLHDTSMLGFDPTVLRRGIMLAYILCSSSLTDWECQLTTESLSNGWDNWGLAAHAEIRS
jgi:hypothetical protein